MTFRRNRHPLGVYTNDVQTQSNEIVLVMITVKLIYCCTFQQHWCKLPKDGDGAETCRGKLILKYTIHRKVHLLVLIIVLNSFHIIQNGQYENRQKI